MSVVENVMTGQHSRTGAGFMTSLLRMPSASREQKVAFDKTMALLDFVSLSENAFDQAVNLAYGKKRLLEIARALASEPKLLLLDEPAAGMNENRDRETERTSRGYPLQKEYPHLLVEHDMKLVMGVATGSVC